MTVLSPKGTDVIHQGDLENGNKRSPFQNQEMAVSWWFLFTLTQH